MTVRTFCVVPLGLFLLVTFSLPARADSGSLRERLLSPDSGTETQALQELGTLPPAQRKGLVMDLRAALRVDAPTAEKAAKALAQLGPGAEEAIPELIASLRYDEESVYVAAGDALLKAGPAAVYPLTKTLTDSNLFVRRRAAQILGKFGPRAKSAAPELVKRLQDPEFDVQAAAQDSLVQMGEAAVPALADALRHSDERNRKIFIDALSKMGPAAAPFLMNTLKKDGNPFFRTAAADALAALQPPAPEAVSAFLSAIWDLEESVRGAAVDGLGAMGQASKSALGPLILVAHVDKDPLVRQKALQAVGNIGPGGNESLLGFAGSLRDTDPDVRSDVLAALATSSVTVKDSTGLIVAALKDSNSHVRVKAIEAAGALAKQSGAGIPFFKLGLTDPQPEVRSAAILALGNVRENTAEAARSLIEALKDPNPALRHEIIGALGNLGTAGLPGLLQELKDDYAMLSDEASRAIVKLGAAAVPALESAQQTADPVTNKKIAAILKRIHRGHYPS